MKELMKEVVDKPRGTRSRRVSVKWGVGGVCLTLIGIGVAVIVAQFRPTDLERAEEALARHNQPAAVAALRAHLSKHPNATAVRYQLALLVQKTNPDEALAQLLTISKDAPEYLEALRRIAVICLLSNRHDQAETALRQLEQVDPNDFGVQLSLAELYFHQQQYKQAVSPAERAIKLQPTRVETYLLLAEIYDDLNRTSEILPVLRKAVRLAPDNYDVHMNLAYACFLSGLPADARREAKWCIRRKPNETFTHRILAAVARDEGRFADARRELDIALKLNPDDLPSRILEADLLMYDRRPKQAYKRLKPLYENNKNSIRYLGALSRSAAASGRRTEAKQLYTRIARLRASRKNGKTVLKE